MCEAHPIQIWNILEVTIEAHSYFYLYFYTTMCWCGESKMIL